LPATRWRIASIGWRRLAHSDGRPHSAELAAVQGKLAANEFAAA
jgi:hypothetical protein